MAGVGRVAQMTHCLDTECNNVGKKIDARFVQILLLEKGDTASAQLDQKVH